MIAAVFTPMTEGGEVNYSGIRSYINYLLRVQCTWFVFSSIVSLRFPPVVLADRNMFPLSQVVSGFLVGGTTGEGLLLTAEVRKRLLDEWVVHSPKGTPIFFNCSSTSLDEAKQLAQAAKIARCAGILCMCPLPSAGCSEMDVVSWCTTVANVAPEVPFYYYHFPDKTGCRFSLYSIYSLMIERIPSLRGVKFSDGNIMDLFRCQELDALDSNRTIFIGKDELILTDLFHSGKKRIAAMGSTFNFLGASFRQMEQAWSAEDVGSCQAINQKILRDIASFCFGSKPLAAQKYLTALAGLPLGPVQFASQRLTAAEEIALKRSSAGMAVIAYVPSTPNSPAVSKQ